MRFLTDKISKLNIGWNERPLTEADFYCLCKRFNVNVKEESLTVGGFYYRVMGGDYISVNSRLGRWQKLAVLFHEIGHFLFHVPQTGEMARFHHIGRPTRLEREADLFAICAIIPKTWIETRSIDELVADEGFPPKMIEERYIILERYGI